MQEKYGFIYIWYDRKRKMFYIGCHWGTTEDGYICSSNRMRDAYRRRPEDFRRKIIQKNISRSDLFEEEFKWLQKAERKKHKYYNLKFSVEALWHTGIRSAAVSQKISKTMKGRKLSESHKKNISNSMKNKINYIPDTETRKKMSISAKNRAPTFLGKKHSEETKNKIRNSKKIHLQEKSNHPMFNKNIQKNLKIKCPFLPSKDGKN